MSVASQKQSLQGADRLPFGEHVQQRRLLRPRSNPLDKLWQTNDDLARYLKGMEQCWEQKLNPAEEATATDHGSNHASINHSID